LRGRGFSVVTFDWRGQGGSDRLLADARKAHIDDFADYDQDLDAVIRTVADPIGLPKIAMAHSMGGNILLRRLHDAPGEFAAAILCAPMLGINFRGAPGWAVKAIARFLNRKAPSPDFVWGMGARDQLTQAFDQQIVTSDPVRYARNQALLKADPDLRLNGPTWSWLAAAVRSIALLRSPGYAEAIATKSILFGAGQDQVCETPAAAAFAARMPDARFVEIAGAEHEILMERDALRDRLWSALDDFLQKSAPAIFR
ncbi:MAG: alpha/beta hydrolase, partial [Proteobacteria bacterium]|nr:alpha/beta hydrolase [Pseudomonadota bacterium]